ncbi:MAG: PIN domain-containing protein [Euryarchaeota archaeon]|nr:PIN domain-containing protein [Euryarchaeota archaeon]
MPRVYLDANVWGRIFDEQTQLRIVKEKDAFLEILRISRGAKIEIVSSAILEKEIEDIAEDDKRILILRIIGLFAIERINHIPAAYEEIMNSTNLKPKDAAHIASAVELNAEYFITVDDAILKRGKEIERLYKLKVCNPVKFLKEI